jgi:hypothetical protein
MIMSASTKNFPAGLAATHLGRNCWNGEFERIHLLAAARIRGETVDARHDDNLNDGSKANNRSAHEALVRWRRSRSA